MSNNIPSVGIRPWGTTPKHQGRQFDNDLPRLPYMRMQPGINTIRILTGIGGYSQVKWKGPKSKGKFGDRVRTAYPAVQLEECPVYKYLGLEGKERNMVVAIDRNDKEEPLKLVDLSQLTSEQIETNLEVKNSMRKEGQKVSPRDFDISIKFDPKSKVATGFYSVVAGDVCPLDDEDLKLIEDVGGQEILDKVLQRALVCPKPETVEKRLRELGWDGSVQKKTEAKGEAPAPLEEPEEDDYSFQRPTEGEAE
jgi:hypothetical protein